MKTKRTVTIDEKIVAKTKRYAGNQGDSLSQIIEIQLTHYFLPRFFTRAEAQGRGERNEKKPLHLSVSARDLTTGANCKTLFGRIAVQNTHICRSYVKHIGLTLCTFTNDQQIYEFCARNSTRT